MSRITFILSFIGSALTAVPVDNISTQLFVRDDGRLLLNANFIASNRAYGIVFELVSGNDVVIPVVVSDDVDPPAIIIDTSDHGFYRVPVEEVTYPFGTLSFLGIGPESPITQQSGSVAVIRRNSTRAEFIINATEDFFRENCRPGTLVTLDDSSPDTEMEIEVNLWHGNVSTSYGSHQLNIGFVNRYHNKARIPYDTFNGIMALMRLRGFVPRSEEADDREFLACSKEAIQDFPTIEFRFETASIVFFPHDYIDFNESDGSCTLRVSAVGPDYPIGIEPVLLTGQNVRVTRDYVWEICDSSMLN